MIGFFESSEPTQTTKNSQLVWLWVMPLAYTLVEFIFLTLQWREVRFISTDLIVPVLSLLALGLAFQGLELLELKTHFAARLFDVVVAAGLVHYMGVQSTSVIFLFFLNIIMSAFLFGRRSWLITMLSCALLNLVFILSRQELTQSYFLYLVGNQLGFMSINWLALQMSQVLSSLSGRVAIQGRKIRDLKLLNEMIVSKVPAGLITFDNEVKVNFANPSAQLYLNRLQLMKTPPASEWQGSELRVIWPELFNFLVSEDFQNLVVGSVLTFSVSFLDADAEFVEGAVVRLVSENGEKLGWMVFFLDQTKIYKLRERAKRSEKLAAIGQLAAGIAHEIRNPLAGISGSVQLLKSTFKASTDDDQKLMNIMIKEIDRLNGLVEEFLSFVRPDELINDTINVNDIVHEIEQDMMVRRSPIKAHFEYKSTHLVRGNRDKLRQVLLNLVINAEQAMVTLADPNLFVISRDQGDGVEVVIRDNGSGMNAEVKRKLFEPFYTTKPKGTGLGLAIVHKIIEAHRGQISVNSEEGMGSEFVISLPGVSSFDNVEFLDDSEAVRSGFGDYSVRKKGGL
ncbi:MAG: hypothetical protein COT74_08780 [Bdellovibrionales bacterium CG10_big_fil_rev_8_21_14_0_10_45_34]|nr:MAG: hypothetical protein COT74_08780 [Bdellovibrionales bacterium CG10_big_fil_rev_8_21_14_0_10_45_34]